MMFPPIFAVAAANSAVQSALGTSPVRFFLFGEAPEKVALPYAVWQTITGSPENYLGNAPDVDTFSVQIDVYGSTPSSVRAAAQALRDALGPVADVTAWRGESRDFETRRYRFSFDVDFWTPR